MSWEEAWQAYAALVVHHPMDSRAAEAAVNALSVGVRLGRHVEALSLLEDVLAGFGGPAPVGARLARALGRAYLEVPHWGVRVDGIYLRGKDVGGPLLQTYAEDRKRALLHLERACRWLDAPGAQADPADRVAVRFDLAGAHARFTALDPAWPHPWDASGAAPSPAFSAAAPEAWLAAARPYRDLLDAPARGLEVGPAGEPVVVAPLAECHGLEAPPAAAVKCLLDEARRLDVTSSREHAAVSLLLQGLLFQRRHGTNLTGGSRPEARDLPDDQVVGSVGRRVVRYTVPGDENALLLARRVVADHPATDAAADAWALAAAFHLLRGQEERALEVLREGMQALEGEPRREAVERMVTGVTAPAAGVTGETVVPPGTDAVVAVEARNVVRPRVTVGPLDGERVVAGVLWAWRGTGMDRVDASALASRILPAGEVKEVEVAAGEARLGALTPGWHAVEVRDGDNPAVLARGVVRVEALAVVVLPGARAAWVVDASTGAPVTGAVVEVHGSGLANPREGPPHRVTTGRDGMAGLRESPHARLLVVRHGARQALLVVPPTGPVVPAAGGTGLVAAAVTARPTYGPGGRVEGRVFVRRRAGGAYAPAEDVGRVRVTVRDPAGKEVHAVTADARPWGGVSFALDLDADAAAGRYQLALAEAGPTPGHGVTCGAFDVVRSASGVVSLRVEAKPLVAPGAKVPVEVSVLHVGGPRRGAREVEVVVSRASLPLQHGPGEPWDWLYGEGHAWCRERWGGLPWWDEEGPVPCRVSVDGREVVREGRWTGEAGPVGLELAGRAQDGNGAGARYVVEASATLEDGTTLRATASTVSSSRRWGCAVWAEQGYLIPGDQARVHVGLATWDGTPVAAEGALEVAAEGGGGPVTPPVEQLALRTDGSGQGQLAWSPARLGAYRLTFRVAGAAGAAVDDARCSTLVPVLDPRLGDLTRQPPPLLLLPGPVAAGGPVQVLVGADRSASAVVMQGGGESPAVVTLGAGAREVTVVPPLPGETSTLVRALAVSMGRLEEAETTLRHPPRAALLDVEVRSDESRHRPGALASLRVATRDASGTGCPADVLLVVQAEEAWREAGDPAGDLRRRFWGQPPPPRPPAVSNLQVPPPRGPLLDVGRVAARAWLHGITKALLWPPAPEPAGVSIPVADGWGDRPARSSNRVPTDASTGTVLFLPSLVTDGQGHASVSVAVPARPGTLRAWVVAVGRHGAVGSASTVLLVDEPARDAAATGPRENP
jgi:hypothetical protein